MTSRSWDTSPARLRAHVGRAAAVLALAAFASACRQDMHDAPRYDPLEYSAVFPNGSSARPLVDGTVARGTLGEDELLTTGKVNGQVANEFPFALTRADLDRGEERYNIYCAPCHAATGEGNGMVVQRGYRQPPSYHIDRLRQQPNGYYYDVITNGFGAMPDYRAQIAVDDRWRIVGYIRALQLTRQAAVADVPAAEMQRLQGGQAAAPPGGTGAAPGGGQQ